MNADQRLTRVFVELADILVDEFDVLDFLHTLTDRTVELLRADAAGVILNDQHGHLKVAAAATTGKPQVAELFELQNEEGPALDCFTTGNPSPTSASPPPPLGGRASAPHLSRPATGPLMLCHCGCVVR